MVKSLAYSSTLESMMIFNFMTMKCFRDTFEWAKNIETFFFLYKCLPKVAWSEKIIIVN